MLNVMKTIKKTMLERMVAGAAGGGETLFWIGGKTVSEVTLE